jgi:membrane protease YdiL (CAAX protease family)
MAFSVLPVVVILVSGQRRERLRAFREVMIAQWKPSLAITALYLIGYGVSSGLTIRNVVNAITLFCHSLLGLALAHRIAEFEPFPVARAVIRRERKWRNIILMLVIALLTTPIGPIASSASATISERVFGETRAEIEMSTVTSILPSNPWLAFLALLAGAGIAEETTYRLLLLTLLWRITRRRWLAILLSAVLFGAYHLSPFNRMVHIWWQFPISQFLATTMGGLVLGYLHVKRGYETSVLSHTLGDWIPFALQLLFQSASSLHPV